MSFKNLLIESIDNAINNYIEKIASTYELDANELKNLWNKSIDSASPKQKIDFVAPKQKVEIALQSLKTESNDKAKLSKLSKNELVDLCREKGYKVTGSKADLVERLCSLKEIVVMEKPKKLETKGPQIIKQLNANIPNFSIRKNVFGNFEHAETSLVFDDKTKMVIGKQNDDGTICVLTRNDIDICNKYKFQYEIPTNLNESKGKEKVTMTATDEEGEEDDGSQLDDEDFLEEEDEELTEEEYDDDI